MRKVAWDSSLCISVYTYETAFLAIHTLRIHLVKRTQFVLPNNESYLN